MTSPPDISSLSLSHKPQGHDSEQYYEDEHRTSVPRPQYHFSTSPPIPAQSQYSPLSVSQTPPKQKAVRAGLPTQWMDNVTHTGESRSMSPNAHSDMSSLGGSPPMGMHAPPIAPRTPSVYDEDDIIPTAIVIKNIPFNVRRETLLDIIASLNIPTPYAFNYHLDQQGSFRGLAFANFREAEDARAVVVGLNGFDVQGRKLRVEYKKVLQAGEKERIEREKAIRRMRSMQLDRQDPQGYDEYGAPVQHQYNNERTYPHSPNQPPINSHPAQPHFQPPTTSLMPASPYQQSARSLPVPTSNIDKSILSTELDLNDAATLEIYSRILLFKDDRMRDELAFSRNLTPKQRRVVHLVAQKLGVYHYSVGDGDERHAVVTRIDPNRQQQTVQQPLSPRHTLSRAPSAYLSAQAAAQASNNSALRVKKSMPDMKTLHSQTQRLNTRSSNGNIREGFNTIASTQRRSTTGFSALFGGQSGSTPPPVPMMPSSMSSMLGNGMEASGTGVVRQPRGPGETGGFSIRRDRVIASESAARTSGLEARSHEPLEI